MADTIIGRKTEQEILHQRIGSESLELIAIYSQRQGGKRFFVCQYFNDVFSFFHGDLSRNKE